MPYVAPLKTAADGKLRPSRRVANENWSDAAVKMILPVIEENDPGAVQVRSLQALGGSRTSGMYLINRPV